MIPDSLRTRGVFFAYMFGPPRFLSREEASRVHGKVCDKLRMDDLAFKYGITGATSDAGSRGFSITLERSEGKGGYKVEVDNQNPSTPIRLLMSYTWPPSLEDVKERLDMTAEAVLGGIEGDWTRVMAEVRLRAQCNVRGNDAVKYLASLFAPSRANWIEELGKPLSFVAARFEVDGTPTTNPLETPRREFTLEVLREDRRCVYVELMSQWMQLPAPPRPGQQIDPGAIRPIEQVPSAYMEDAYDFLSNRVQELGA